MKIFLVMEGKVKLKIINNKIDFSCIMIHYYVYNNYVECYYKYIVLCVNEIFKPNLFFSVYFDVHGCQMNVSDTEIAWSVLQEKGFDRTSDITQVFKYFRHNTCSLCYIFFALIMTYLDCLKQFVIVFNSCKNI